MNRILKLFVLGMIGVGCSTAVASPSPAMPEGTAFNVLVFTKTAGFRHASIPDGIALIQALGSAHNFAVQASEDAAIFNEGDLAAFDVVIFLNTTGDILNEAQQTAVMNFVESGGGFVGVHSASDTEYDWPWYGSLVGAYFDGHPAIQEAVVHREDATHLSTIGLPDVWPRTDEWYNFRDGPGPNSTILLTVDEASYSGGTMGKVHPIAWYHSVGNGRSWYTAMGHTSATYQEPLFQGHLLGGIRWAAGMDLDLDEAVHLPLVLQ